MERVTLLSLAVFLVVYYAGCVEACPDRPGDDFAERKLKADNFYVYWKVVDNDKNIQVITCVNTDGWYGIGFSESNSMKDSDVVVGWYDNPASKGEWQSGTVGSVRQKPTAVGGVWDLKEATQVDGWSRAVYIRAIAASTEGVPVKFGTNRVIWAYRNGKITDYGGVEKHGTDDRGTNTIVVRRSSAARPTMGLGVLVAMTALGLWRF